MPEIDPNLAFQLKLFVKEVVLPPYGFITLALIGVLIARYRRPGRRFGTGIALIALLAFYLSVIPPGSRFLMAAVERDAGQALDEADAKSLVTGEQPPQAIVILGGGSTNDAREKPYAANLTPDALARAHAGARLARWTALPILTSGGAFGANEKSEGEIMARVLKEDLLTAVRWVESGSFDTVDNASMSAQMLKKDGVSHIVLLTQAFHIPRSRRAFEDQGFVVTPAPIGFMAGDTGVSSWIPYRSSRDRAQLAYKELIGSAWYWLRRKYVEPFFDNLKNKSVAPGSPKPIDGESNGAVQPAGTS